MEFKITRLYFDKNQEGTANYYIHMYMYVSAKERHSLAYVK